MTAGQQEPAAGSELSTLLGLVQRYSPSGLEAPATAWLVEHMQTLGYTRAFVDQAGNAVGVMGAGPRQVVLLGHIDTVPGEITVRVEGDLLYGRGSVDAKGPLSAFVDAVARLGTLSGWQLVVIGAVEEERNSDGARHAAASYRPDFAVIGEPSRWDRVTLGYKGSAWATVSTRRELAHTARLQESACEAVVSAWEKIKAWAVAFNSGRERAFDQAQPALRGLSSGEDGFAEWASIRLGVRLPLDLPPDAWYASLEALLREMPAELIVERLGHAVPAYQAGKNTPLVRAFLASIRAAGGQPGFLLKTGTADLNIVAPAWDCPALVYGPGDSALDHTPNERLSLGEYRRAVSVVEAALRRLTA